MGHSVGEDPHRFQAQQRKEGVMEHKSFYHFLVNARLPSLRTNRKDMRTEASSWSLVFILVCGNGVVLNQEG